MRPLHYALPLAVLFVLGSFASWAHLGTSHRNTQFAVLVEAEQKPPEDKSKRPSPPAPAAVCKFSDGKTITVDYSVPSMKGRKIFGERDEQRRVRV